MGLQESGATGRNVTESIDAVTGLLLQNPEGMVQSGVTLQSTAIAADDAESIVSTQYGQPFIMAFTVVMDDLTGGRTSTLDVLDPAGTAGTPNGPSPFLFRVIKWWVTAGASATAPEGTLTINHLDSASAANAMSEAYDLNLDQNDVGFSADGAGKLIAPYDLVDEDEGLQLSVLLGSTEQADFTIYFMCMRVVV
ncbi:hypothetical protein LCGC14_0330100 [marine sediment metagenome]|uniref:Uncharacterized protein n=1 Tax=marine sediment metagenome TaxID=412755 RepID=A0A0F9TZI7_9ZZZZ